MPIGKQSENLYERACKVIPGGVNSPVRAFKGVAIAGEKTTPVFIRRAKGSRLTDVDGKLYVDMVGSWGPMIFGHADETILKAIADTAVNGTSFGAPTELEVRLAEKICAFVPSIEKVRLVNSGTEATMSAIRLARAATKREKIIKFDGCYHGHGDSFLVAAGSGAATLGVPDSPGVPSLLSAQSLVVPYNDLQAVAKLFRQEKDAIAAVIVEPVAGNMGCVLPEEGFLQGLRDLCTKYKAILVFDEVMTGFRLAKGGAQQRFGILPDLTCLGKIIGGGLPVGAYGGRADLMAMVAPEGPVYQAGTLSGNPLAVSAGLATLEMLDAPGPSPYDILETRVNRFATLLKKELAMISLPTTVNQMGSMFSLFLCKGPVKNYDDAKKTNRQMFAKMFHALLDEGIYFPPSAFEACFVSLAHSDEDLDIVRNNIVKVLQSLDEV